MAVYRERLATVRTLRELLDVGRELQQAEREAGNVTVLAQMLAGSQGDPKLAEATRKALALWVAEIELTVRRLLAGSRWPSWPTRRAWPGPPRRASSASSCGRPPIPRAPRRAWPRWSS